MSVAAKRRETGGFAAKPLGSGWARRGGSYPDQQAVRVMMESGEDSSFEEEEHKVIDLPRRSTSRVDEEGGPLSDGVPSRSSASPRGNDVLHSEGQFGGIGQAGSLARFVKRASASTGSLPPSLTVQQFLHPALNVSRFLTDFRCVSHKQPPAYVASSHMC
jgi:hypothetical protein